MKCFDCNHENEKGSKFCSNCGKDFKAKKRENDNLQAYPDPNAVKMHEDRLKERSISPITVTVMYLFAVAVAFVFSGGELAGTILGALFISPFALAGYCARKSVKEEFYYTLPSSKDSSGNHRCIFCGNKGIHKSTIYRTQITANTCTKCRKELFRN